MYKIELKIQNIGLPLKESALIMEHRISLGKNQVLLSPRRQIK